MSPIRIQMIDFPNAKINLGLQIKEKRPDGFHNLESIFFPVQIKDALEIIPAEKTMMNIHGIPVDGDVSQNLCLRAFNLLKADFDIPSVEINLLKNIPMGAGMGGGSSDGTFALIILNKLFNLDLSRESLHSYALNLGSDCPFFLYNSPVLAQGRGEIISPIKFSLDDYFIQIVHPGIHISTKMAFEKIIPRPLDGSLTDIISLPVNKWKDRLINDFEDSIFQNSPALGEIKRKLYENGALYSSMTGTGSAVFGIFERKVNLDSQDFPNCRIIKNYL